MSQSVEQNQKSYATKNGYHYVVYRENLAKEMDSNTGKTITWEPYWSKITAINKILNGQEEALDTNLEWIVWMDDDAVVTNPNVKLEEVLRHYANSKSGINLVLTEDSMSHSCYADR